METTGDNVKASKKAMGSAPKKSSKNARKRAANGAKKGKGGAKKLTDYQNRIVTELEPITGLSLSFVKNELVIND